MSSGVHLNNAQVTEDNSTHSILWYSIPISTYSRGNQLAKSRIAASLFEGDIADVGEHLRQRSEDQGQRPNEDLLCFHTQSPHSPYLLRYVDPVGNGSLKAGNSIDKYCLSYSYFSQACD